jgi:hypothetical protein
MGLFLVMFYAHQAGRACLSPSSLPTLAHSPPPAVHQTGFDPSWSSLCHLEICSGTNLRLRRLVPNFYGNLRLAGAQTVWLLHFMLQMYTTQQKTSILNNNHPTKNNTMVEPVAGLAARL